MKSAKEIAEILYYHQDANEAVIRAMHLPENEFLDWSSKNPLLTTYAMGSCQVYFPMLIIEETNDGTIAKDLLGKFLYDAIHPLKQEIKKHYNERFTLHQD